MLVWTVYNMMLREVKDSSALHLVQDLICDGLTKGGKSDGDEKASSLFSNTYKRQLTTISDF